MKQKTKFKKTEIGMIPEDWEVSILENCVGIIKKSIIPLNKEEELFHLYSVSAYDESKTPEILKGKEIKSSKFLVEKDMILFPKLNLRFKRIWRINQTSKNSICSTEFFPIKTGPKLSTDFLYYLFQSPLVIDKLQKTASGTSGSHQRIKIDSLKNLSIPIPSLPEQRAIAKILSDLDSKIELLQKQNETLEKIGQAIFKHWFVDFDFPNEEGKPYKSSGGEMIYNEELGKEIPKGWEVGFLGDEILTKLIKSGINNFHGEKIYLDTASVQDTNIIDFSTRITINKRPSRANMQPIPKSIWFAKMKNSKKVLLIDEYDKFILNNIILSTGFAGIKTLKNSEYYIWNIINSDNFEKIKNSLCLGTTMQAINNENIKKIKYLIPLSDLLIKFNNLVKENYKKISINKHQIQTLQQIRDLLLPKLMTGKIRVPLK